MWAHYKRAATDRMAADSATPPSNDSTYACRGVAIALKLELTKPGSPLQLHDSSVVRSSDGRLIHCHLEWAGHIIRLVNVYLPNDDISRKSFLENCCNLAGPTEQLVIGGDFNFVMKSSLDRPPLLGSINRSRPESGTIEHWGGLFPGRINVWRQHNPRRPGYTWFSSSTASRIDRCHVGPDISFYSRSVRLSSHPPVVSDHKMVAFAISARDPTYISTHALIRIKLRFEAVPELVDAQQLNKEAWLKLVDANRVQAVTVSRPSTPDLKMARMQVLSSHYLLRPGSMYQILTVRKPNRRRPQKGTTGYTMERSQGHCSQHCSRILGEAWDMLL